MIKNILKYLSTGGKGQIISDVAICANLCGVPNLHIAHCFFFNFLDTFNDECFVIQI